MIAPFALLLIIIIINTHAVISDKWISRISTDLFYPKVGNVKPLFRYWWIFQKCIILLMLRNKTMFRNAPISRLIKFYLLFHRLFYYDTKLMKTKYSITFKINFTLVGVNKIDRFMFRLQNNTFQSTAIVRFWHTTG